MRKIDSFTNLYPISKTLRFRLVPVGQTEQNFINKQILESDEKRAEEYKEVKRYIDRYHKAFVERKLSAYSLPKLQEYAELYYKKDRTDEDKKVLEKICESMRKDISACFTKDPNFKLLFDKEMIRTLLPEFLTELNEKAIVEDFRDFTTYFVGFHTNRKNLYTGEGKATEIAFRIVDDNLPKYLDNCRTGRKILDALGESHFAVMAQKMAETLKTDVFCLFDIAHFNSFMSQSGIDIYNQIIGGYNEYINLYNQKSGERLPLLKPLYKQILSDRTSESFMLEQFKSDNEAISCISKLMGSRDDGERSYREAMNSAAAILGRIDDYDLSKVFVKAGTAVTDISNKTFGSWSVIQDGLFKQYADTDEGKKAAKKTEEKFIEARKKYFKAIKSYSLEELQKAAEYSGMELEGKTITGYIKTGAASLLKAVNETYASAEGLLTGNYPESKNLCAEDGDIALIKAFLDAVMDVCHFTATFTGSGDEAEKDEVFYGLYSSVTDQLKEIIPLYSMVRNYVTRKPYSTDKIKLNFNNSQLLGGWDANKEKDYLTVLLVKDGEYFLAVMDKEYKKSFEMVPEAVNGEPVFDKVVYKYLPGPNKMLPKVFFSKKGLDDFKPSDEILRIYSTETFKKGDNFDLQDCRKLIDFYKDSISAHPDWSSFGFILKDSSEYDNIGQFYNDVKQQGYKISFRDVPVSYIDELINDGKLYLFKLYNKDFSKYSKGTPNLHTLYFRMLFDETNLANPSFVLNGGAEMFYRKASIKDENRIVHPSGKAIDNKNPDNQKKQSLFDYDIVKDRRYTQNQFFLHVPITLNFKASEAVNIGYMVRQSLREAGGSYVIGIDRGERNLLYISVIDEKGNIVEQHSLNRIINEYNGSTHVTDYHRLLDSKESGRLQARKDWKTIENISNLKEGYLSQVVHKICELVEKYDAVIAMEDLNSGFKHGREKVEKQVYQKFEKMLADKLQFMADKKKSPDELGGLLNAYQLVSKDAMSNARQNGIVFYIPAWLTSKIDPTTGFADLLRPRYESIGKSKEFFEKFDGIRFNAAENYFEFETDYTKFQFTAVDYRKKWTICTYGKRIRTFRNPEKNSEWDNESIDLTEEFKKLFTEYRISFENGDIKSAIYGMENAEFFRRLTKLLSLTLQMRNSITGTDIDYLISPVKNERGEFYCSDAGVAGLPEDADANGAYNIARKAQWAIEQFVKCKDEELYKANIAISNAAWLEYAQTHCL